MELIELNIQMYMWPKLIFTLLLFENKLWESKDSQMELIELKHPGVQMAKAGIHTLLLFENKLWENME
jgi:hypothetical protein